MPSINTPDTVDFKDQNVNTDGEYLQNGLPLSTGPELTPGAPPILGDYSIPSVFFPSGALIDVAPVYEASHPGSGILVSVYVPLSTLTWNVEISLDAGSTWLEVLAGDDADADTTKLYHINFDASLLGDIADAFFTGDISTAIGPPQPLSVRAQANYVIGVPGPQYIVYIDGYMLFQDPNTLVPPGP